MAYNNPAQYGTHARPYTNGQAAPKPFPSEQWQNHARDDRNHGHRHPPADDSYPVHQTPAQIQRYQQQLQVLNEPLQQHLQTWDRPHLPQVFQHRPEGPSDYYVDPYQSQGQYPQAPGYGSAQYSHVPEEYGYTHGAGSNIPSQQPYRGPQLMYQPASSNQRVQYHGYPDSCRTRPPPQRSHSDGFNQPNERVYINDARLQASQGQQISYTSAESTSSTRLLAPQEQRVPYKNGRSGSSVRPAIPQGQQVPYTKLESSNSTGSQSGQIKLTKASILSSPISPESLSWDNPFPTFPTNKKKVTSHDRDGQRPPTASSSRSHESASAQPAPIIGENTQKADPKELKLGLVGPPKVNGTEREYPPQEATRKPENGYRARFDRQKQPNNMSQLDNESHSLPSSPGQSKFPTATHSNMSLHAPAHELMKHSNLPCRANGPAPQPDRVYKGQPLPQHRYDTLHQPTNHVDSRPIDYGRSHSLEIDRCSHHEEDQVSHPSQRPTQVAEGSYDDHLDSYYEPIDEHTQPQSNQRTRLPRSNEQEDMPNFNAIPAERVGHGSGITMDQQLHLGPEQPASSNRPMIDPNHRGRSHDQTRTAAFAGQAHRSRSQPNYCDQRQLLNHTEISDFGAAAPTPPLPAMSGHAAQSQGHGGHIDASSSRAPLRPAYGTYQYSSGSQRQFLPPQDSRQNHNNSLPVVQTRSSIASRVSTSGQGSSPVQHPSKDSRRGPTSPLADERLNMSPQSGRSQDPLVTSGDNSRLPSASVRRLSNPDALPEHPSPVRPVLATATNANLPKPPPVRQYNGLASPSVQPSMSQQAPPRRSIGNSESVPVTHEELQRLGQSIKVHPNDQKTQLLLAQKMVEAASVLADEGGRADAKTRHKNREKYLFDAHKLVKKLASGGYPEAMFYMADCHGRGLLGLQADPKEAFSLYQSAAKLGHAQSAYRVAVCCEMGQEDGGGTRKDPLKAVQWYKRAATLGDSPAMYKMGMIQLKGLLGQPKNTREAVVWLKRAAERADEENPHSLHELGLLYESASGNDNIIRDEAYSKQLFSQAAKLGYKFSQYRLGSAYEYGHLGCPIDPRESIAWYSKAAVQEEHQSELALSGWYLTGSEGVLQQSDTEAYLWARKAALAGLAKAEYAMGYFTEVGIGVKANMDDAKRWYWRASSQNFPKARERLEDLRKGGARMEKSRVSRSAVNKQSDSDCSVM
ncbi:hypothetical protein MMC11_000696 [Xylographa trunciseda]|nr:hypothetical protein [Xylographa trunciseda]